MIKKWVKLLPYWFVMKYVRNMNGGFGTLTTGKEYKIRYFQIDEGEFVVFASHLQEVFDKRRREKMEEKRNLKLEKINKQFDKDYKLKDDVKKQILEEIEEDRERMEFDNEQ